MAKLEQSQGSSVAADLVSFLNAPPTAFHAVGNRFLSSSSSSSSSSSFTSVLLLINHEAKKRLSSSGYEQVSERKDWSLQVGKKYFFIRNYSTIVAFAIGKKNMLLEMDSI
ncbi:hypothetical protein ACSBR2_038270 [Camellia fascicularis]